MELCKGEKVPSMRKWEKSSEKRNLVSVSAKQIPKILSYK